ncbi:hypothetical protein B296_00040781 [Ensete ventricosum]|uniref:Uncharacterized protein n=1 Tax=Ensete ventricosum TaxID=4639 RepID=A0A426XYH0_ENSVE|nr:hypothetical protein B296_00040781 [Ensete ventricosum]
MTGTVVKHKRGKILADLAQPGNEVLVARGGQGGVSIRLTLFFRSCHVAEVSRHISLLEMQEHKRKRLMALTTNVMRDESDKVRTNE